MAEFCPDRLWIRLLRVGRAALHPADVRHHVRRLAGQPGDRP